MGKIVLLTGKPDCGKSLALLDLITHVTNGADFPDGSPNTVGASDVLLAASEDDPADTIIPRLMTLGADLTKVKILRGVRQEDATGVTNRNFSFKSNIRLLLGALNANPGIKLILFDPISSYLGAEDANNNT